MSQSAHPFQPSFGLFGSIEELRERAEQVAAEKRAFSYDIETGYHGESRPGVSVRAEENLVAGISFTNSLKWSRYAVINHDTGPNLDERAAAEILYPLLVEARDAAGQPLGVAHGGKFELRVLSKWFERVLGVKLSYQQFRLRSDTMLESYAEGINRHHGLKELTELQAKHDRSGFWHAQLELHDLWEDKLTIAQRKAIRFNVLDPLRPEVIRYVCEDTVYCLAHHRLRYPRLQQALAEDPNSGPGFIWRLEMAVLPVVCEMEDDGIWYDWPAMQEWGARGREFAGLFMQQVRDDFGTLRGEALPLDFNFGSSPQLRKLFYEDCAMPVSHWTKGGKSGVKQPGTDAKVALKGLSATYPEVAQYLQWKRLTKLYRDFLERFEGMYRRPDGRAHPSLLQHGVPAGRFAHKDPNYAQSPKKYHYELRAVEDAQTSSEIQNDRGVFDFNFRDMIGAPPGFYMLGFDLGQAELRAVAGMAGERKMIEAFEQGIDVHAVTASLIFGVPVDQVTKEQRDVGKTMGLALVYGLTEDGLAERLGITREDAEDLFAAFHAAYPAIKEWTEKTVRYAREHYCVFTWWGRRVPVWNYVDADEAEAKGQRSWARSRRREGDRTAGNAPVQGSATGDYMKLVMVRCEAALRKAGLKDGVRLVMNVHDALEFYVRKDIKPVDVIRVLQPAVIFPVRGWPPLAAEWHVGERWGSVKELAVALDENGRVLSIRLAKKEGPAETDIDLEEEDEDDVAPAVPLLDLGAVKEAVAAAPGPGPKPVDVPGADGPARGRSAADVPHAEGPGRTVIVTCPRPPRREDVQEFVRHCQFLPGANTVRFRHPNGEGTLAFTSALSPADEPLVSVLLGGATVAYDEASVDLAALAAGVTGI